MQFTEPFLKWAGGKRWLIKSHRWLFPHKYRYYFEPFLGGGSVFLSLGPDTSFLSDLNPNLINVYSAIQRYPDVVSKELKSLSLRHSNEFYYHIRAIQLDDPSKDAARFIYLNRTCFNGLYRVNLKGQFNVPRGTKNTVVYDTDNFEFVSGMLSSATLSCGDFAGAIDSAGESDFVFLDPPYTVAHNQNGFLKYNEQIFSWKDQIRLRDAVVAASKRGAQILILNACHDSVKALYQHQGRQHSIKRFSTMAGSSNFRKPIEELAIQIGFETAEPI